MNKLIDGKPPWYTDYHKVLSQTLPNPQHIRKLNKSEYKINDTYIHSEYKCLPKKKFKNNKNESIKKIEDKYIVDIESDNYHEIMKKKEIAIKAFNTKWNKKVERFDKCVKAFSYNIKINKKQHDIIYSWVKECDKVYNYCVKNYNTGDTNIDKCTLKLKVFKELYGNNDKIAPYDTLTDVVAKFCSNVKSCYSNLKNGNITHFKMKEILLKDCRSIFISYKAINKNGIFTQKLGNIESFPDINCECDCRFAARCGFLINIVKNILH